MTNRACLLEPTPDPRTFQCACGNRANSPHTRIGPCPLARGVPLPLQPPVSSLPPVSRGLGDTIARITTALGISPCGGCKERQAWLNRLVPYGQAPRVADPIIVGLASIPSRADVLPKVVASLLHQSLPPTAIHIYLNGYAEIPPPLANLVELAENLPTQVVVHRSQQHGDLGSRGKFFGAGLAPDGYRLTCDDDILYPPNYVETLVSGVERYGRRALVGIHGVDLVEPIESYRRSRKIYSFRRSLSADRPVHILGSGTLAWHTDAIRLTPADFALPNLDDPQLGVRLQRDQIPALILTRPARWLIPLPTNRLHSIGHQRHLDDSPQTSIVRQIAGWRHVARPTPDQS